VRESFPPRVGRVMGAAFRLMPSAFYLSELATDRSHMRRADGSWLAPPPPWDAPGAGRPGNLLSWIDPRLGVPGRVLDLEGFLGMAAPGQMEGRDARPS
ncbi:MAG TPA: hypothetical protein VFL04_02410, partial [Rectinemataceae bacterium]|nr:hypothetical protein [Rectinemataceae bacterium]